MPNRRDMSRRLKAKSKICRRLGSNLWGRAKSPLAKRESRPGMHGAKRKKVSDFGVQLMAKQRLKGYYGEITEKQFRRTYEEASSRRGDTAENLVGLLERRLDMIVYRLNFVPTIFAARQIVNHGHIHVNGRRVNIPSYRVREGDLIEVRSKSQQMPLIVEAFNSPERDVPEYIEVDTSSMKGSFVRTPKLADIPYPVEMEPNLVVEYYSR